MKAFLPDLQSVLTAIAGIFGSKPETVRRIGINLIVTFVFAWVAWQVIKLIAGISSDMRPLDASSMPQHDNAPRPTAAQ